jgi:hypothetical protein
MGDKARELVSSAVPLWAQTSGEATGLTKLVWTLQDRLI